MSNICFLKEWRLYGLSEKIDWRAAVVAVLFSLLCITYWLLFVKPMQCLGGMDCVKYSEMARSFSSGFFNSIEYPFNLRFMAPWLSSVLSDDVVKGFLLINIFSIFVFVISLYFIAKELGFRVIEFFVVLLLFFWHPLGFGLYFRVPISVDPLWYALLGVVSFLFISEKIVSLWVVMLFALFVKESFVFVLFVIVFSELVYVSLVRDRRAVRAVLSIIFAIAVFTVYGVLRAKAQMSIFPQVQGWEITILTTVSWWFNEVVSDPWRLLVWIGALVYALGVFPVLIFGAIPAAIDFVVVRRLVYMAIGGAGFALLGVLGGSDMSRIIFNGGFFFILFLMFASAWREESVYKMIAVLLCSVALAVDFGVLFSHAFEYDYYMNGHRLWPTVAFLVVSVIVGFVISFGVSVKRRGVGVELR